MQPADIPAPLAGLAVAAVVWGLTYLLTVDWLHPHPLPRRATTPEEPT